jgi:hypothetical protein
VKGEGGNLLAPGGKNSAQATTSAAAEKLIQSRKGWGEGEGAGPPALLSILFLSIFKTVLTAEIIHSPSGRFDGFHTMARERGRRCF